MRLKIVQRQRNTHKDLVSSVAWCGAELFSCGDEGAIWKWDKNGEPSSQLYTSDTSYTEVQWLPAKRYAAVTDANTAVVVVGCTDGSFRMITKQGRVEKIVEKAHLGAVTSVRWNSDGSILTAGEDGSVKLGRSILSMTMAPTYNEVLVACGKDLVLKPLQANSKQYQWQAHEGAVLKVDWNPVNNLIVSCGEDCRYRVWDSYGRMMFSSSPADHHITSVAWCPDGELFAVGSFNTLALCDKTGWTHSKERTNTGSIYEIAWTSDGTQLAAAGGNGAVALASITSHSVEWGGFSAALDENNHIRVMDLHGDIVEEQEFRYCHIFSTSKWSNPIPIDLKDTVTLLQLAEKCFMVVDGTMGVQVFNYEGRVMCSPKFKGLRPEFLNAQTATLSSCFIAMVDRTDGKNIHVFDVNTGRPTGVTLNHNIEVAEIALSHHSTPAEALLAFIDRNSDLYITPVAKRQIVKMSLMIDTLMWHEKAGTLAAVGSGKVHLWYYPPAAFIDPDLMNKSCIQRDPGTDLGLHSHMVSFETSRVSTRKTDGTLVVSSLPPYPVILQELTSKGDFAAALKLCRYVKDPALWTALAATALHLRELNTAQIALAAIEEVDKLRYITRVAQMQIPEVATADLLLFKRQPAEAEAVLVQGGHLYRAIKLNIRLFKWERALDLAVKYKTHIDTVMGYRGRYLEQWGRTETNAKFLKYVTVKVDWDTIKKKIREEKENELRRAGVAQ
eukprot:m51a1_g2685 putative intraflagellar transport protein 80 homolog (728) ;mRNA; f:749144-752031